MNQTQVVILDCYTDEPSGFGVRPYLGTHQLHLSQALAFLGIPHLYLTIDDLRYATRGVLGDINNTDLSTFNRTTNCDDALKIIHDATLIYIVMGCFVDYAYFSALPPKSDEVYDFLKDAKARKVLFYVLGTVDGIAPDYKRSKLSAIVDQVEFGNAYRFVLESSRADRPQDPDYLAPNYALLDTIAPYRPPVIPQLRYPVIAEIETGTGCSTPFCYFCIESLRSPRVEYRSPGSIIAQVRCLYGQGIRHFRLGRQPNIYDYQHQDLQQMEALLAGIRESCPDIETLHVDNANIISVTSPKGKDITKLIVKYCTSGNVIPLGIESFDDNVRKAIRKVGTAQQALQAVSIIGELGQERGTDGLPKLLPGINLIYGLPGQSPYTQQLNLLHLTRILQEGLLAGRLFFRKMTSPTGVTFASGPESSDEYTTWLREIVDSFVLPMQERVYPNGLVIQNHREVILRGGDSYMRTLSTCPIRMVIRGAKLEPYGSYDVRVTGNLGYRLLEGRLQPE